VVALPGRDFAKGFETELTPAEMLRLGVFGGKYMTDCGREFPKSWFARAKLSAKRRDPSLNFFGVDASQPLSLWRKKGWLHPDDPRGWFQWYCRYYIGRRMPEEDARQIRRWKQIKRHVAQVRRNCEEGNLSCRKRQRQALLHWAYDSRKDLNPLCTVVGPLARPCLAIPSKSFIPAIAQPSHPHTITPLQKPGPSLAGRRCQREG
jgi:hypothetical protein